MTENDFNQNPQDSQKLNISKMSITELVSRFLAHHQAGEFDLARPFLSELVDRQDQAEEQDHDR